MKAVYFQFLTELKAALRCDFHIFKVGGEKENKYIFFMLLVI